MRKSILYGILSAAALLAFYIVVMLLLTGSWGATNSQLKQLWPWFTLLIIGFGTQFGLFTYLKTLLKTAPMTMTAANTGMSGVSMVACCAHHLTDVLPFFGLAGLALFLTRYQVWLIGVGIASNLIGIIYISRQIRRHLSYVQN